MDADIHIPGYRIEQRLGHGGMASVYRAVQEAFDRPVAIKVMDREAMADPAMGEQFLHEARVVAGLSHPNIVQVHDVGNHAGLYYLVMEFLGGGSLDERLQAGLTVADVFAITCDLAGALAHAHAKGYVHCDIKPGNVLFRESGGAVLTDFGIARSIAAGPAAAPRGTVPGTPHYMSPEQAAGGELDGRSDLYSLGVLFHRMLTGSMPFDGATPAEIAAHRDHDPVPQLPRQLESLQPLLDRMLARDPAARFQSGEALVEAIQALELSGDVPRAFLKADRITTAEVAAVRRSAQFEPVRRAPAATGPDPIGPIAARRDTPDAVPPAQPPAMMFVYVTLAIAVLVGGGWLVRDALDARTDAPAAGAAADPAAASRQALDDALRSAWASATAAPADRVAAWRAVLSIAPDNAEAATELDGIAGQLAAEAQVLLDGDEVAAAVEHLEIALALFADEPRLTRLREQAVDRSVAALLQKARDALAADALAEPPGANALEAFQRILEHRPDHAEALQGMHDLGLRFAALAAAALDERRIEDARTALERGAMAAPDLPELAEVRTRFAGTREQAELAGRLVAEGRAHAAEGRLTEPPGRNAAESYARALAQLPGAPEALRAQRDLATALLARGQRALVQRDVEGARRHLALARASNPEPAAAAELESSIRAMAAVQEQVNRLMNEAGQLVAEGYRSEPAAGNAPARLTQVLEIDPGNAGARRLLGSVAVELADVARSAADEGLVELARVYYQRALAAEPGQPEWLAALAALDQGGAVASTSAVDAGRPAAGAPAARTQEPGQDPGQPQGQVPAIAAIAVSASPVERADDDVVQVGVRSGRLYVAVRYSGMPGPSVAYAVLRDASRAVDLTQVPVILPSGGGDKSFQIPRPVEGFLPGGYVVEVRLGERVLASTDFQVADRPRQP